jgi:hypothetical protein
MRPHAVSDPARDAPDPAVEPPVMGCEATVVMELPGNPAHRGKAIEGHGIRADRRCRTASMGRLRPQVETMISTQSYRLSAKLLPGFVLNPLRLP